MRRNLVIIVGVFFVSLLVPYGFSHAPHADDRAPSIPVSGGALDTCDCIDMLLIVDDTADMASVVANLATNFSLVIWPTASGTCGDVRCGIISFKDEVTVDLAFSSSSVACQAAISSIVVGGGGSAPEASDQALQEAFDVSGSSCTVGPGFDPGTWRDACCKLAVLMTGAEPGGCDDAYDASDSTNGLAQSILAFGKGVMIEAVYEVGGGFDPAVADLMARYAANTGGIYAETVAGAGLADAISEGILKCADAQIQTEFCCVLEEPHYCVETLSGLCGSLGGNTTVACVDCAPTGVVDEPRDALPSTFALHQNVPNPFNPTTVIWYDVPDEGVGVSLRIYDVTGQFIRTLVEGNVPPGRRWATWDGRDAFGVQVSSGVYFCSLRAGNTFLTMKMVLLK